MKKKLSGLLVLLLIIGVCLGIYFGFGSKRSQNDSPVEHIEKNENVENVLKVDERNGKATTTTVTKNPNKKIIAIRSSKKVVTSDFIPLGRKENGVKYTDRVQVKRSRSVDTTPIDRFKPSKNFDITYWRDQVLPYEKDRNHDQYIVIPRLWIVVPLVYYTGSPKVIKKEFNKGAVLYPEMAKLWEYGNALIGGHSSAIIKKTPKYYRNIFTTLPELDPGDEVRWYARKNGERYRYRYIVTERYAGQNDKNGKLKQDIVDVDPSIQEMTLYTCIPIGTSRDRRIVKAHMKEERKLDDALQNKLRNK